MRNKKFYITTAIAYLNAPPHLGHAMQFVRADVLARYHRLKKSDVFFLTGTDEYGSKLYKTAKKIGILPEELVDKNAAIFKDLDGKLDISYDDFIRTTDKERHWPAVNYFWKKLEDNGDIYPEKYKGYYCSGCEDFLTERELVDGKCIYHNLEPELVEEENYFFRLSKYQDKLLKIIEKGEVKIFPESRKNEALNLIKAGLKDISFSRSVKNLPWGIPVPGDNSQVIYVWADALVNYISALGYGDKNPDKFEKYWPADIHVIGKDNLKFHALYWPAMLMSAGLSLPKEIYVHGFVTSGGQKMSKSLGNVVDPFEMIQKYGSEALRYYLLREISAYEDGDFTEEKLKNLYQGDLANGLGNFLARVLTMALKMEINARLKTESSVAEKIKETSKIIEEKMSDLKFNEALAAIWELISFGDNYINKNEPWKISDSKQKEKIIFNLIAILEGAAEFLAPFLPKTSKKILANIEKSENIIKVYRGENLFPRI
ncbi:MAG: methionyl-tRNA synthetase, methionyl-tRNA synthetase [Candidatus Wolfebacteria bacterium GW2011_GWC1_37_10]|uniref:Methionine--tRNA ligase n=1 Tax=Candidatus Wolfebacteria bacterium GW2011_GWC1_37_10 TaxID=1619010 RepID=A0A0G0FVZ7_9BACT|nr:MAG: methionyl-tRNA synthetase, methionyl-tRNA synthetase [Candidatus Wolfebacteria bacterium GW2011_GWC1_37_10]